jgi:hypothetical protein
MFFRRKDRLRMEFDKQLVEQVKQSKQNWDRQKGLFEKSIDPFGEMKIQTEIAKAKYVFLLREAKKRKITVL